MSPYLAQGERSVEELVRLSGLSVANTSKHLQQLKAAGLVNARRDGKYVRYSLGDERALDALAALRGIAQDRSDAMSMASISACRACSTWVSATMPMALSWSPWRWPRRSTAR